MWKLLHGWVLKMKKLQRIVQLLEESPLARQFPSHGLSSLPGSIREEEDSQAITVTKEQLINENLLPKHLLS